jgi:hypothetical protein
LNGAELKPGDWVVYVPGHAHGDVTHFDCERGTVTSIGETSGIVFVRYGAQPNPKATSAGDLVSALQYFAALQDSSQRPSQRQPRHSAYRAYLGDGLFADFDGHNVVLSAENGEYSHDTVYLEPRVLESFKRWHASKIAPLFQQVEG